MAKQCLLLPLLLLLGMIVNQTVKAADENIVVHQEVVTAMNNLVATIEQDYLLDNKREQIIAMLTSAIARGEFNEEYQFGRLKRKLESSLFAASNDANFAVHWRAGFTLSEETSDIVFPAVIQSQFFNDNVGYLQVDGDLIYANSQDVLDEALIHLASADALIIDLRKAGQIDLELARRLLSQLMPAGLPIAQLKFAHDKTQLLFTDEIEISIAPDVQIVLLTSPFVAGAWEFVGYTLQREQRATIVGSPTMGLSQMTTTKALSENISLIMAYAELRHPATGENWQNEGVIPDVQCDVDDLVRFTQRLITGKQSVCIDAAQ